MLAHARTHTCTRTHPHATMLATLACSSSHARTHAHIHAHSAHVRTHMHTDTRFSARARFIIHIFLRSVSSLVAMCERTCTHVHVQLTHPCVSVCLMVRRCADASMLSVTHTIVPSIGPSGRLGPVVDGAQWSMGPSGRLGPVVDWA